MFFSISDLEQLSGVSTHTIRIWERRYNALKPERSPGNTRVYNSNQLRRLLNIVSLNNAGVKISDACAFNDQEISSYLEKEIIKNTSLSEKNEFYISQLIAFAFSYDEYQVDNLWTKLISKYGMIETYKEIIYPLLVRMGLMWRMDKICVVQEHFLSCLIKQKIFAAINDLPFPVNSKSTWVLFLPEDEDHELGLLFANYILRLHGLKVVYLGPKVPLYNLETVLHGVKANQVLLFMVRMRKTGEAQKYLARLDIAVKNIPVYLAGNADMISGLELKPQTHWLQSLRDLEKCIIQMNNVS